MFYIYKYNSRVLFSSSEMQSSGLPGTSRGRAAASSWGRQVFSQPGTVCPDRERVKAAAPVLGALQTRRASGAVSMLRLPSLPAPGCQSAVTRPHISRLSAKQLMRLSSELSIIFVSLLRSGNILAQRNKETWAITTQSGIPPVHGHQILKRR